MREALRDPQVVMYFMISFLANVPNGGYGIFGGIVTKVGPMRCVLFIPTPHTDKKEFSALTCTVIRLYLAPGHLAQHARRRRRRQLQRPLGLSLVEMAKYAHVLYGVLNGGRLCGSPRGGTLAAAIRLPVEEVGRSRDDEHLLDRRVYVVVHGPVQRCWSVSLFTISPSICRSCATLPLEYSTDPTAGRTKKSVASGVTFVGYCLGNIVGSQLYIPKDAPIYRPGLIASAVCFGLTFFVILLLRLYYIVVNKSRDRKAAQSGLTAEEQVAQGKLNGANDMTDLREY